MATDTAAEAKGAPVKPEAKPEVGKERMDASTREMKEVANTPISIEVGGVTYPIKSLTMNERIVVQEHFDVSSYSDLDIGDMRVQRYIVWTLLVKTDSTLTEEQVGEMFDAENQDDWDYAMFLSSFKGELADMEALASKNQRKERMATLQVLAKPTSQD